MNILIVDSDRNSLKSSAALVKLAGHAAYSAISLSQADKILNKESIDAVFLDRTIGDEDSLPYLRQLLKEIPNLPVIISTKVSSIESAVTFIQNGAYSYLEKPFHKEHLKSHLTKLRNELRDQRRINELQSELSASRPAIILESLDEATQYAYDISLKAAASEANILLLGPSGNGKSVLARKIHESSNRADEAFITVSCPSLSAELLESELFGHVKGAFTGADKDSRGKVQAAHGGTLFLDEIGETPMEIQPRLLRLLQEQEFERVGEAHTRKANVRVISATNRDLEKEVEKGKFREDLLYRLNVISITIPSIRERKVDLERFAQHFLQYFSLRQGHHQMKLSKAAMQLIMDYDWPGNLRELSNVIERATILAGDDLIQPGDLSISPNETSESTVRMGGNLSLQDLESAHIRSVLERVETIENAASVLGIDTATLYRKRKKMGLL